MREKIIIIYQSIYNGNTKKVALAMANALHCEAISCEVASQRDLAEYTYVGLGSGIYFTSHHPELLKIAAQLGKGQQAFLFSTHGAPIRGSYHNTLSEILAKQQVKVMGHFSCRGYDCTGPYNLYHGGNKGKPNEKYLLRAAKFVRRLLPQFTYEVNVPEGKHVWIDTARCVQCGCCYTICPMNVFEKQGASIQVKSEEDCVHCNLCLKNCKCGAIGIKHTKRELIGIAKKHAWRKSL